MTGRQFSNGDIAGQENRFAGGKEYIPLNKEKANAFLQTCGAYSVSVGEGIRSTGAIVKDSRSDVKGEFSLKTTGSERGDGFPNRRGIFQG